MLVGLADLILLIETRPRDGESRSQPTSVFHNFVDRCEMQVDVCGLHSFKHAPYKPAVHAVSDVLVQTFSLAGIRVDKEPSGLFQTQT